MKLKFMHQPVALSYNELQSHTDENGFRRYTTPDGRKMPSITSVLSDHNKEVIEAWKANVGEEEAEKIRYQASWRGGLVHECLESYLMGVEPKDIIQLQNPVIAHSFIQIKNVLDADLEIIYGMEKPLYSDLMEIAGRADLIAKFKGKPSVIDFKTSLKVKRKDWIENYFMQAVFYAIAWQERTGMPIEQLVLVVANDESGKPQVFIEPTSKWVAKLAKYVKEWKNAHPE